jgi:c-di-GMP-binding flagellar brake protein YcgR
MPDPRPSPTALEHRRSRRTRFVALAKIYDHATRKVIGYLGDIATGGMMLHVHDLLSTPGSRLITIHLPHPDKGMVAIDAGIRVAWQQKDPGGLRQRHVGCEFVALNPTDRLLLLQTARAYGIA